jgi:predicted secreted protein
MAIRRINMRALAIVGIVLILLVSLATPALAGIEPSPWDESTSGKTLDFYVNDTLTINLQSNHSTGFEWQLDQINTAVLQLVSHQYIPPPGIGSNGTEVWVFQPIAVGTSPIIMEYSQPWQGGTKAAKTYNVTVNFIPGPAPISAPASTNLTTGILVAGLTVLIIWITFKRPRQSRI